MITAPKLEYRESDHTFWVKGVRQVGVTECLTSVRMIDYSMVFPQLLDKAKHYGSNVHLACYMDDSGELDFEGLSIELLGYVLAWKKFRAGVGIASFEMKEEPICDPKLGLAGIPDRVAILANKQWAVIEIKTNQIPAFASVQTAFYELILGKPCKRFGVALKPTGKLSVREFTDRNDRHLALGALQIHQWKREHGIVPKETLRN